MELLLAPQNWPFLVSLGLVVALSLLQIVLALLGGAISVMDADVDLDVDADIDTGAFGAALEWLHVGKIPGSILLILFGLCFGISGITAQSIVRAQSGAFLPTLLASGLAFGLSLPLLRLSGLILRPVLPRDESEAVSSDSFLGCEAEITIGTARRGQPAQAKVRDKFGKSHYVLVEPDVEADSFVAGSRVLLLKRHEHIFRVIEGAGVELND